MLSTSGSHHLNWRLTSNGVGHYLSRCVAASWVVSHGVIRRLEASKYPPLPGETWIIPMPRPPTHTPPQCTTNSAQSTNTSSASDSVRKAHYTLSITDARSPHQAVLMWSLPAWRQEREEMLQSLSHCTLKHITHTQTLCFPYPTPPS